MDAVECAPKCLLGWPIKTKAQIWFNWIVPNVLEQLVYIVLIVADLAVTYQHFNDGNHLWGGLTLSFIWLPAILCFGTVIVSPRNWPEYYSRASHDTDDNKGVSKQCLRFLLILFFNVLLFPIAAMARFGRRLFWSIEALFHDKDSYERYQSLSKAAENSVFELYHFLQAFTQSGPQLLLQLFIVIREDVFRNYDTAMMQAISIIFSLMQMATIAENYQRFERQRMVGRNYPWHPTEMCQERKKMLERRTVAVSETPSGSRIQSQSMATARTIMEYPEESRRFSVSQPDDAQQEAAPSPSSPTTSQVRVHLGAGETLRKTLHVDENNLDWHEKPLRRKSSLDSIMGRADGIYNIEIDGHTEPISDRKESGKKILSADVDKIKLLPASSSREGEPKSINEGAGDGNMMEEPQLRNEHQHRQHYQEHRRRSYLAQEQNEAQERNEADDDNDWNDYYYNFDTSPTSPPPPLPVAVLSPLNKILNYPLNRLSTIKDMFLLDTELYVKEHVPRLPEKIARHEFKSHHLAAATATKPTEDTKGALNSILISSHGHDAVENPLLIKAHWTEENLDAQQKDVMGLNAAAADENGHDHVDGNVLMMPRRKRMIVGLEQEDFFAKTVGFLGWYFFLLMRVLAISVFAMLHWREALYILICHYLLMLGCLLYEVKMQAKLQRLLFYLFLSYVYVFVIMEFKIKFIHLRMWYGLYVGLVFTQNFVLSVWWYTVVMDFELWWFDYLFRTILGSGVLSLCCLLVYYLRLKPKDKVLFELMEESDQDQQ